MPSLFVVYGVLVWLDKVEVSANAFVDIVHLCIYYFYIACPDATCAVKGAGWIWHGVGDACNA